MRKKHPDEKESCYNCKYRVYKFRPGGPFNYCKKLQMFFEQREKIDEQLCEFWEF